MNWFIKLLSSTLGRKLLMALTGLFLILFLVVHLIGNLQLLKNDGGEAFNVYAKFMTSNPIIVTISYVNYACILVHVIWALFLTIGNKRARGDQKVCCDKKFVSLDLAQHGYFGNSHFNFPGNSLKDLLV